MTGLRTLGKTRAPSPRARTALPPGRWTIDQLRSTITFKIRHLTVATVRGGFERFDGWFATDESGFVAAAGAVETASVSTADARRDAALLAEGFFDAERYPSITLTATELDVHDGELTVVADLTMKGTTRPIRLTGTVVANGNGPEPVRDVRIAASGTISRAEFGVTGGGVLESHGAVVSDTVTIELDVTAIREPEDER